MSKILGRAALSAMLATMAFSAALVRAATFTFDPSQAIPALAGPGSAFTADTMVLTNYLYAVVNPPNGVTPEHLIQTIDGFTLGGAESDEAVIDREAPDWRRLASILDAQLPNLKWLAGSNVTIVDIAVAAPMYVHKWWRLPLNDESI